MQLFLVASFAVLILLIYFLLGVVFIYSFWPFLKKNPMKIAIALILWPLIIYGISANMQKMERPQPHQ